MLDMHVMHAYDDCIMKAKHVQYTIRNIPERVDQRLREQSAAYGTSLNDVAVKALSQAVGIADEPVVHHDLDDLIGSWVEDAAFDEAVASMDQVDEDLWR